MFNRQEGSAELEPWAVSDDNGARRGERAIWNFITRVGAHHSTRRRTNSAREPTNNSHASPTNNAPAPRTQPPPRRPRTPQTKLFIAPPPRHVFVTGNTRIFTGGQTAKPSDISRGASAMSTRSSTSLAGCAVRVCITNAPICENVLVTFRLSNLQVRPTTQLRSIT